MNVETLTYTYPSDPMRQYQRVKIQWKNRIFLSPVMDPFDHEIQKRHTLEQWFDKEVKPEMEKENQKTNSVQPAVSRRFDFS